MKKVITLILATSVVLSMSACGNTNAAPQEKATEVEVATTQIVTAETTPIVETEAAEEASYEITDCTTKTWVDSIGSPWIQTIVEISNTGSKNLYLSSGSYDLEDASGSLIASRSMVSAFPNVIAPGEKGYMYEETILDQPVEGELKAIPRVKIDEATVELIRYNVTDTKLAAGTYGGIKALGRVENTSSESANSTYVVAFLYNADGKCIGQMFTIITDELAPGDKIGFEMSGMSLPDDVSLETIAEAVYYAYPMQLQLHF